MGEPTNPPPNLPPFPPFSLIRVLNSGPYEGKPISFHKPLINLTRPYFSGGMLEARRLLGITTMVLT